MRRQKFYTVAEAMEAALWCHYCGDSREADRILRLVINHVIKEPDSGQGRQSSPSRG
jgi:hypothetical protein